jgi:hypothetical protein
MLAPVSVCAAVTPTLLSVSRVAVSKPLSYQKGMGASLSGARVRID